MIKMQTITIYSVGDGMPVCEHLLYGYHGYNRLKNYHELNQLEAMVKIEISALIDALDVFDGNHPIGSVDFTMCSEMKSLKRYLENCLDSIQKLQHIERIERP